MILCDSGPLFAAADLKDADHHACVELFTGLRLARRRLLVPATVVAEDGSRMAELVNQYDDLPLGTTDASVIALAERLGIREVATLDRRHFTVVRPRHVEALSLLPE